MGEIHARELKTGSTIQLDGKLCKVVVSRMAGTGKLQPKTHITARTIPEGKQIEKVFHPDDRVQAVSLDRRRLAFSYPDGDAFVFVDGKSYEEFRVPEPQIRPLVPFLKEDTEIDAEFLDNGLVDVVIPELITVRVASAAEGLHGADANTPKTATLENGLEILVPQFVKAGDVVRVEVAGRKYIERVQ